MLSSQPPRRTAFSCAAGYNCSHEIQPAELAVRDRPKRRWFQFTLRTFLLVVTLVAMGLGLYVAVVAPIDARRRAALRVSSLSGRIVFEEEPDRLQPRDSITVMAASWLPRECVDQV